MENELNITTERIDDFVLLLGIMKQMDLPTILDRHILRHHRQQGLSWGWVTTIWLAHIVSQGDHRKQTVRDWARQARHMLKRVTGFTLRDTDFTDDRLGIVLRYLSQPTLWQAIEQDLGRHLIQVYALETETVRVDATTASGYHMVSEDGLMQFGYSKDDPTLPQIKLMMGTLDPLGLPLASEIVSGEKADDPLYVPIMQRMVDILHRTGLLFVGDSKMGALDTRGYLQSAEQFYLMPLPLTGETAQQMPEWIKRGDEEQGQLPEIHDSTGERVIARGYEFTRQRVAEVNEAMVEWEERVLVVQSLTQWAAKQQALQQRLEAAEAELHALTPPRCRGKRQTTEEADLRERADAILKRYQVVGLLTYEFERQVEQETRFVGRGRGNINRPTRVVERIRYQITRVSRNEAAIAALAQTFGWRAYATNAPVARLSLRQAVLTYRQEYIVENSFGCLKGAPLSISPLFVKRDDQIAGLTHLLTLAVRLLSLIEFVARRTLQATGAVLVGLYPGNPRKATAKPTANRLLQAFNNVTLTIIHLPDRLVHHLTPLTPLQERILTVLNLSQDVYRSLAFEIPNSPCPLRE